MGSLQEDFCIRVAVFLDGGEMKCVTSGGPIPQGRARFCSEFCIARYKRLTERRRYGHRHLRPL